MVTTAQSTTGLWHILGKYGCQDADPSDTTFEKQRPLDEFEFRISPPEHVPPLSEEATYSTSGRDPPTTGYPERDVENGINKAFCKRCGRSIGHWLSLRHANLLAFRVRLDKVIADQDSPREVFHRTESPEDAEESCEICGKPESAQWFRAVGDDYKPSFNHIVQHVCETCYRGIRESLSEDDRNTGIFRAGMNEDIGTVRGRRSGHPLQKPVEAPLWYEKKERQKNPKTERDKGIVEMADNIHGLSANGASRLYGEGIDSLETLATTNANTMTDISGIGETKAIDYVEKAREALREQKDDSIEFSQPVQTGVCQNCGAEYPDESNKKICPACCPHDGEIVQELNRTACQKCNGAVTQDENGQWRTAGSGRSVI